MKKRWLTSTLLLALAVGVAQAQTTKSEKSNANVRVQVTDDGNGTRVHVEKEKDGKTETIERTFSDQASADRFLDSVNADTGNRMRVNVRNRGSNNRAYIESNGANPAPPRPPRAPSAPRGRIYNDDDKTVQLDMRQFNRDMEKFGRDMERWGREYGEKMKDFGQRYERDFKQNWKPEEFNLNLNRSLDNLPGLVFDGNGANSSRTVKALSAYPNQPFNGRLNVTFQTPEKGDVTIAVTDVAGKEVARERVKDFSGKYVGQIDLKKGADKGTYFLTVTQGNDGTVKRIVIE
ncbi:MAG: T9SS type A sorting domain-containing protein [Cytophagaceae bacterium]|nr:T9SS type A sorting domain-containing protein [Cytophagaceae bacterium]